MSRIEENIPYWSFYCKGKPSWKFDNLDGTRYPSQLELVWNSVRDIHNEKPDIFPKKPEIFPKKKDISSKKRYYFPKKPDISPQKPDISPKKPDISPQKPDISPKKPDISPQKPEISPKKPKNFSKISFFSISCRAASSDESTMISAAKYLRQKIDYPFCIFGYVKLKSQPLYLNTPCGKYYKRCDHGWKIISIGDSKQSNEMNPSTSASIEPPVVADSSAAVYGILPSQISDKDYVYYPSSEEAIDNMYTDKGGKWMVFSPGWSGKHDSYWLKLIKLCQEGILTGLKASTSKMDKKANENVSEVFDRMDPVIMCYTANADDVGQVSRAARAIREAVDLEYVMYYKTNLASNQVHEGATNVSKYMHTAEGDLFVKGSMGRWGIDDELQNTQQLEQLRICDSKQSKYMNPSTSASIEPPVVADSSAAVYGILPSQVSDKDYVYYPSSEEAIDNMYTDKGGKWMVFSPGWSEKHDSYWLKLIKLCQEGVLTGLKASTSKMDKKANENVSEVFDRMDPVIMCYTANADDVGQVSRAARAIREVVDWEYVMYYKTNLASNQGQEGATNVSKYMHTAEGDLFVKGSMGRWGIDDDLQNTQQLEQLRIC